MDETPGVVLAVYAHPDDADVGLRRHAGPLGQGGQRVHLVVCTDGGKGTVDPDVDAGRTGDRRAAASSRRRPPSSGSSSVDNLGFPDGELADSDGLPRHAGRRGCGALRPDVVCGHDPTAVFFGQDYFNHRDHRIAGAALLDAVRSGRRAAALLPRAGPPHQVATVLLRARSSPTSGSTSPTPSRRKAAAVECHRTQFAGQERLGRRGGAPPGGRGGPAGRRRRTPRASAG